jgi:hypothetical protein
LEGAGRTFWRKSSPPPPNLPHPSQRLLTLSNPCSRLSLWVESQKPNNLSHHFKKINGKAFLISRQTRMRDSIKSKNFEEGGMGFGEGRGKLF